MKRLESIILLLVTCVLPLRSQTVKLDSLEQRYAFYTKWCSPEKLYLHLDRTYYAYGETIWFNGYLENSSRRASLPTSNFIYVELLGSKGECVTRVKVKRDSLAGFPGHLDIPEKIESGMYTLRAYTIWNLNNPADYMFHQDVKILGQEPAATKPDPQGPLDVSFYPEGGRYFAGFKSAIGFKAMNRNGQSETICCFLVDSDGKIITPFSTLHDGMGAVEFTPEPGKTYFARIGKKDFPLPAPATEGVNLRCTRKDGYIYIHVSGVTPGKYRMFIRDAESIEKLVNIDFTGDERKFKMPLTSFRGGINHLLLVADNGQIASERLFYIKDNPAPKFNLKTNPAPARGLIHSSATLTAPSGQPLDGRFSVSVVRGSFARYKQNDDIISYMRLSSELRGTIHEPSHYFDESVSAQIRERDLDLLMMIQGWRYYDMDQVEKTDGSSFHLLHTKEMTQSITGRIERVLGKKVPKRFIFTVLIPSQKFTSIQEVEQARYFELTDMDLPENTGVVIKVNRLDEGIDYMPRWNGDTFAPAFKYRPAPILAGTPQPAESIPLEANIELTDTLQAAVITAHVNPFPNLFGGRTISGSDLDVYSSFTLVDYVKTVSMGFEYSEGVMTNTRRGAGAAVSSEAEGEDGADEIVRGGGAVKLVMDDNEQIWEMFESITMDEVEAINISGSPDFMYNSPGGLVTVKLKSGVSIERDISRERSMAYFVPLGWQKPKKFYSPRYDKGDINEYFDNRNTIYWNPCVQVDGGNASFDFCNTDQQDYPYVVRIEGCTLNGEFFSCHTLLQKK